MPFTPAHAAAALPFRGTRLTLPAVITGTMAPDFEYFFELAPKSGYGHGWPGVLVLTLPLALLVYWLYQTWVKAALIWLLPDGFQRRLIPRTTPTKRSPPGLVVVSLAFGIATHIAWDSFTHSTTWMYRHWALLRQTLTVPVFGTIQYYKALQYGSTIFGLILLAIWIAHWYRATPPTHPSATNRTIQRERLLVLATVGTVAMSGALIRAWLSVGKLTSIAAGEQFLAEWVITLIALAWWQLVLYGIVRRKRFTA